MSRERYFKLHPDLAVHSSAIAGRGTFAARDLPRGTLLLVMGGQIVTLQEEANLPPEIQDAGVQIATDLVLSPISIEDVGGINNVNHCCDPNAGFQGQIFLVAMRDIAQGEEVTFDYAMCLGGGSYPLSTPMPLRCRAVSRADYRARLDDSDLAGSLSQVLSALSSRLDRSAS